MANNPNQQNQKSPQADRDEDLADGGFAFEIVDLIGDDGCWPERTAPPIGWL